MKVSFSGSYDTARNFRPYNIYFNEFHRVILSDIYYSPHQFANRYRKSINYLVGKTNMIILDFDENLNLEAAKKLFSRYKNMISTTKSHGKDKNGKLCDRFRIIFPVDNINLNSKEYVKLMKLIAKKYFADTKATDSARFFYGYKDSEYWYNDGDLFDWRTIYFDLKLKDSLDVRDAYERNYRLSEIFGNEDRLKKVFKPDEIFEGDRNNMLARYALWLRDEHVPRYVAEDILNWINNNIKSPLPERELVSIIRSKF